MSDSSAQVPYFNEHADTICRVRESMCKVFKDFYDKPYTPEIRSKIRERILYDLKKPRTG